MTCFFTAAFLMLGAAALGFALAWVLKPSVEPDSNNSLNNPASSLTEHEEVNQISIRDEIAKKEQSLAAMQTKYDNLYNSKLDVDTALMMAESTLDGLKKDYERLEMNSSKEDYNIANLKQDFDRYKEESTAELEASKNKQQQLREKYESAKFKLAKTNRINEKLHHNLEQLKSENKKLETSLEDTQVEMDLVNQEMLNIKQEHSSISGSAQEHIKALREWEDKYKALGLELGNSKAQQEASEVTYKNEQEAANSTLKTLETTLEKLQQQLKTSEQSGQQTIEDFEKTNLQKEQLLEALDYHKKRATEELETIQDNYTKLNQDYEAVAERELFFNQKFDQLENKYDDLELNYHSILSEKEQIEDNYLDFQAQSTTQLEALELQANEWLNQVKDTEQLLSGEKEKVDQLNSERTKLQEDLKQLKQLQNNSTDSSNTAYEALNTSFDDLKERYLDTNKELTSVKFEKDRMHNDLSVYQEQIQIELEILRKENKRLNKSVATVKTEKSILKVSYKELNERLKHIEEQGLSTNTDQGKLVKVIHRLRHNIEAQGVQIEGLQSALEVKAKELKLLQENLSTSRNAASAQLTLIEGIDTYTFGILTDFGIHNFQDLAKLSLDNQTLVLEILEISTTTLQTWMEAAEKELIHEN